MVEPSPKRPGVAYPNAYVWLVFFACLDLLFTWLALGLGGLELNPLADRILLLGGYPAMVVFKLGITVGVIAVCEFVARRDAVKGRTLAYLAVVISAIPFFWTLPQVVLYVARIV